MKMSLVKKIALVMAVVLVVGACAGLIVHKTAEGSQSVVKRPAEGSGSSDLQNASPRIFLKVASEILSIYSLQILDGEDPSPVYGTFTFIEENIAESYEEDYTFFLVTPGISRIVLPATRSSEIKKLSELFTCRFSLITGEYEEELVYDSDFEYTIPSDCYFGVIRW